MDNSLAVLSEINWLLVVLIIYVIYKIMQGRRVGFAEMALRAISSVVTLLVLWIVAPIIKEWIMANTDLPAKFAEKIRELLANAELTDRLLEQLGRLSLPESVQTVIVNYAAADIAKLAEALASLAVSVVVFLVLFVLVKVVMALLIRAMNLVMKMPVLKQFNKTGGMLMALIEATVVIEIALIVIPMLSHFSFGMTLMDMINSSKILTWLFEHNLILKFL